MAFFRRHCAPGTVSGQDWTDCPLHPLWRSATRAPMKQRTSIRPFGILTRRSGGSAVLLCVMVLWFTLSPLPAVLRAEAATPTREIPQILAARGKDLTALKAVMSITTDYDRGRSRQDMRGFLIYRRPNDFRFQGLAPGGNSLLEMVIRTGNFELYVPAEGKILKGAMKCFMQRFPELGELDVLIPLALLQWQNARVASVAANDADKTVVRLNIKGSDWNATLDPKELLLRRLEKLNSKSVELTADFGDFKTGQFGWLPKRFDVKSPSGGWRTLVTISKIEVNPFLIEKNFKLETNFSPKVENCE